jgi:hypothetical protein
VFDGRVRHHRAMRCLRSRLGIGRLCDGSTELRGRPRHLLPRKHSVRLPSDEPLLRHRKRRSGGVRVVLRPVCDWLYPELHWSRLRSGPSVRHFMRNLL